MVPLGTDGPNVRTMNLGKMPPSKLRSTAHPGRMAIEKAA